MGVVGIGIAIAAFARSFSGPLEFFVEGNIIGCELDTGRLAAEHFCSNYFPEGWEQFCRFLCMSSLDVV